MIGKSLLLFQILCTCFASQDVPGDSVTYEQLFADGHDAYWNESWSDAITHFREAVDKYSIEMKAREECYARCRDQPNTPSKDYADAGEEIKFLHASLQYDTCVQQCKQEIAGTTSSIRRGIASGVEEKMVTRHSYNYLQFALHKVKRAKYFYNNVFIIFCRLVMFHLVRQLLLHSSILIRKTRTQFPILHFIGNRAVCMRVTYSPWRLAWSTGISTTRELSYTKMGNM